VSHLGLLWLAACVPGLAPDDLPSNPDHDHDGDGFVESPAAASGGDCDDGDASVFPGAQETCDELDQDCDGRVDEEALDASTLFLDEDQDGHGTDATTVQACQVAQGYAELAGDCDDDDGDVNPDAAEICEDGVDNDCDGVHWCELDEGVQLLTGERPDDHAGTGLALGGDLDGDGHEDLVVGAPENDGDSTLNTTNYGATYVFYGPLSVDEDLSLGQADHRLLGVELGRAGTELAIVGDVDGGGLPDLLVGAPGPGASADEARAHLVLSETLGFEDQLQAHLTWTALTADAEGAGAAVSGGGHLDDDDLPELLVGSESALSVPGVAWLIWGADATESGTLNDRGVRLVGSNDGDKAGTAVRALGDIDGDGLDDIAIGAQRWGTDEAGAVFLVLGDDLRDRVAGQSFALDDAIRLNGPAAGSRYGGAISTSWDVSGDGLVDFFVGAAGYDDGDAEVGSATLILGRSSGADPGADTVISGTDDGQSFGAALDLDDLDGDGVPDLIVGAPARGSSAIDGGAYVHLGPVGALGRQTANQADWRHTESPAGSEAGASVALIHGLLGEGATLVMGLPRRSVLDSDAGGVVVVPY